MLDIEIIRKMTKGELLELTDSLDAQDLDALAFLLLEISKQEDDDYEEESPPTTPLHYN